MTIIWNTGEKFQSVKIIHQVFQKLRFTVVAYTRLNYQISNILLHWVKLESSKLQIKVSQRNMLLLTIFDIATNWFWFPNLYPSVKLKCSLKKIELEQICFWSSLIFPSLFWNFWTCLWNNHPLKRNRAMISQKQSGGHGSSWNIRPLYKNWIWRSQTWFILEHFMKTFSIRKGCENKGKAEYGFTTAMYAKVEFCLRFVHKINFTRCSREFWQQNSVEILCFLKKQFYPYEFELNWRILIFKYFEAFTWIDFPSRTIVISLRLILTLLFLLDKKSWSRNIRCIWRKTHFFNLNEFSWNVLLLTFEEIMISTLKINSNL